MLFDTHGHIHICSQLDGRVHPVPRVAVAVFKIEMHPRRPARPRPVGVGVWSVGCCFYHLYIHVSTPACGVTIYIIHNAHMYNAHGYNIHTAKTRLHRHPTEHDLQVLPYIMPYVSTFYSYGVPTAS